MFHLVLPALICTGLAHVSAQTACLARVSGTPRHHPRSQAAYLGTVDVEGNAARHGANVLLLQAHCRAVVAGAGACIARIDTILKTIHFHGILHSSIHRKTSLAPTPEMRRVRSLATAARPFV
jgi:hypothetical protein